MPAGMDKAYIERFWQSRADHPDPRIATHWQHDDALDHDLALVRRYLAPSSTVLDLGCGSCAMINALAPDCRLMVGVEKVAGLLRHCRTDLPDRIELVEADILAFEADRRYDLVLLFGIVTYLTVEESERLYARIASFLKPGGRLIAKHACGLEAEVLVDAHSQIIGSRYVARYPWLEDEKKRLRRHFDVDVVDIYPPHLNKWANTHFYAFVCGAR